MKTVRNVQRSALRSFLPALSANEIRFVDHWAVSLRCAAFQHGRSKFRLRLIGDRFTIQTNFRYFDEKDTVVMF